MLRYLAEAVEMKATNDQIRSRFTQIRSQRSQSLPVRSGLSRLPWTGAPAPPSIGKNQAARPGTVPIKALLYDITSNSSFQLGQAIATTQTHTILCPWLDRALYSRLDFIINLILTTCT